MYEHFSGWKPLEFCENYSELFLAAWVGCLGGEKLKATVAQPQQTYRGRFGGGGGGGELILFLGAQHGFH